MRRPRILAFASACMPGLGSESGAGWVWARMLARLGETWVITRRSETKVAAIEARLSTLPEREQLKFVYVDLPRWARPFMPTRPQGAGRLEYMLWQTAALGTARTMQREIGFDLVWHLTWANAWLGSLAAVVGPPFVYGPVGGGVAPPWRLVAALGARGIVDELLRAMGRSGGRYLNPLARLSWERARLILVQNPETRAWLPRAQQGRAFVFPNAVLEEPRIPVEIARTGARTALFAGQLRAWKGGALAIRAIAQLPEWRLIICGDGQDKRRLREIATGLGIASRVDFVGWRPRAEVLRLMREEADVFLFPSLHDEGSWAVAEAVAAGLPVVCLDRGGPAVLAGGGVVARDPSTTVSLLADAVRAAPTSRRPDAPRTDLDSRTRDLTQLLQEVGLLTRVDDRDGR
ncbi:MAG: glycosyltransferase [Chloroflexota bacterium]